MTAVILILIAILLILLNANAIRKENKSFSQALDNKSKNIGDYEIEIGKLRKEFAETILELQKEIEVMKASIKVGDNQNNEKWAADSLLDKNIVNEQETLEKNDFEKDLKGNKQLNNKGIETDEMLIETYNSSGKKNNKITKGFVENNDKNINNGGKNVDNKNENNKSVKLEEIRRMLEEGLSIDEIAEKVGIGKGEVLLIKELYIR